MAALAPWTLQLDSFSWNQGLAKYVKAEQYKKTLEVFQQMQKEGMIPDTFSFVPILNACANLQKLEDGMHVHEHIIQSGCESNVFVGNSLMDMYAKCGALRMHGESSITCPQGTLCLGMLSCLYM
jgi:pentatricopeptide repeat domain-containing protein 1